MNILTSSLLHILTPFLLFCSCRSSDIATRESSIENRMQETEIVKTATKRRPFSSYLIGIYVTILLILALYFLIFRQSSRFH